MYTVLILSQLNVSYFIIFCDKQQLCYAFNLICYVNVEKRYYFNDLYYDVILLLPFFEHFSYTRNVL